MCACVDVCVSTRAGACAAEGAAVAAPLSLRRPGTEAVGCGCARCKPRLLEHRPAVPLPGGLSTAAQCPPAGSRASTGSSTRRE